MQGNNDALVTRVITEKMSFSPGIGAARIEIGAVRPMRGSGPVYYGSVENREGANEWLTTQLLDHLRPRPADEAPLSGKGLPTLKRDSLGRPFLSWAGAPVPAISFSHVRDRTWAALAWAAGVGIDVAHPEEFQGLYPFARVFRLGEMDRVKGACGGELRDRAALLWSVKEAAVKAVGCGFNLLDPLEIEVGAPRPRAGGFVFEVVAGRTLSAWAERDYQAWMAIALIASS